MRGGNQLEAMMLGACITKVSGIDWLQPSMHAAGCLAFALQVRSTRAMPARTRNCPEALCVYPRLSIENPAFSDATTMGSPR